MINGSANVASTVSPALALSNFSNEIIIDLAAGATVSLQMYATLLGTATLLNNAAGASLMMIRLS